MGTTGTTGTMRTTAVQTEFAKDPIKSRMTALMLICLGISIVILGRAASIQIWPDPRLAKMAKRQFSSKVLIQPRRGSILDRNGEPLAINSETRSLAMNPSKIQDKRSVAHLLAKATDIPYSRLIQRMDDKKEFAWIKRHLTEHEITRLKKFRVADAGGGLINGVWLVRESQRAYPHGELAAHVLGDVNLDSEGMEGTELWMNEQLRGKVVSVSAIKDALGRPAFIDAAAAKSAQEGKDGEPVNLTLDASLQFSVEEELRNAVRKHNAKGGTVIVMNAVNGEILAMANEPSFNPNDRSSPVDRRRNRALTDGYEPGSTMKPILLSSALTHGMKLSDTLYGEQGSFKVQGKRISEAEAHEKFEWISLKKMIAVSSNVGAAKLALKIGADHYFNTLKSFEFATKTGTGFPGEISGRVPARKAWTPLALANIGFGQGLLVTPMQMTRAYAAFLNGGWLVNPSIIKNPATPTAPPKRILSQQVADKVIESLLAVTSKEEGGTGVKAVVPGYRVAGKTGTAQKVDPAIRAYSRSKYVASFIGFPVEVEPKLVIFTSIDEPRGEYYAAATAVPLFHEVLTAVVNRFSMPDRRLADEAHPTPSKLAQARLPSDDKIDQLKIVQAHAEPTSAVSAVSAVATATPAAGTGLESVGKSGDGKGLWKMPALQGMTAREALQQLKGHQFQLEMAGTGLVHTQFPVEGRTVADGELIRLNLSEPQ